MKITDKATGRDFQLKSGTTMEIERTNPFLNDWGEQSLPIDLPDTPRNRLLTGYPDSIANSAKPRADMEVMIADGAYQMPARMAVLGAVRDDAITVSAYLNEGSFYSRMQGATLADVLADETVEGVDSVAAALMFCASVMDGSDERFLCFPVYVSEEQLDDGTPRYYMLNRWDADTKTFWNAVARQEAQDDTGVTLAAGCNVTPFLRVNWLLGRVLAHFGYTLKENFFTTTAPFPDMVLLNNTADVCINGTIKLAQLVPDMTCAELLDVLRHRFCCEFIPDETERTVDIVLLKDALAATPTTDLTAQQAGAAEIEYVETYRQLRLENATTADDGGALGTTDTLQAAAEKCSVLDYDGQQGRIMAEGVLFLPQTISWGTVFGDSDTRGIYGTSKCVAGPSSPYQADSTLEAETVTMTDSYAEMRRTDLYEGVAWWDLLPYIGGRRWLNSVVTATGSTDTTTADDHQTDDTELKPMLCFGVPHATQPLGTTTAYAGGTHAFGYSLALTGPEGCYERFWRPYDALLRNSLHTVRLRLLLTQRQKMQVAAHLPVMWRGQKMLVDRLSYTVGDDSQLPESELRTTRLYTPVSEAATLASMLDASQQYKLTGHWSRTACTLTEYNNGADKRASVALFPTLKPTAQLAADGTHLADATVYTSINYGGTEQYFRLDLWITCEAAEG